jgi:hypothetical protein
MQDINNGIFSIINGVLFLFISLSISVTVENPDLFHSMSRPLPVNCKSLKVLIFSQEVKKFGTCLKIWMNEISRKKTNQILKIHFKTNDYLPPSSEVKG